MHAKTAIFDDDQVIVGSANWTTSGFNTNREADVEVLSCEVNAAFARQFDDDWNARTSNEPIYLPDDGIPAPAATPAPSNADGPQEKLARQVSVQPDAKMPQNAA